MYQYASGRIVVHMYHLENDNHYHGHRLIENESQKQKIPEGESLSRRSLSPPPAFIKIYTRPPVCAPLYKPQEAACFDPSAVLIPKWG